MRKKNIAIAVAALIFGVALFVHPKASLMLIGRMSGVLILGAGIVTMFMTVADIQEEKAKSRDLILPALLAVAGILIILNIASISAVLKVILGILMILNGFFHLLNAGKNTHKGTSVLLILGGITILCGFTICISPFNSMLYTTICGLFFIFDAIVGILTSYPEDEKPQAQK